jgi:hypothetical protein
VELRLRRVPGDDPLHQSVQILMFDAHFHYLQAISRLSPEL